MPSITQVRPLGLPVVHYILNVLTEMGNLPICAQHHPLGWGPGGPDCFKKEKLT